MAIYTYTVFINNTGMMLSESCLFLICIQQMRRGGGVDISKWHRSCKNEIMWVCDNIIDILKVWLSEWVAIVKILLALSLLVKIELRIEGGKYKLYSKYEKYFWYMAHMQKRKENGSSLPNIHHLLCFILIIMTKNTSGKAHCMHVELSLHVNS